MNKIHLIVISDLSHDRKRFKLNEFFSLCESAGYIVDEVVTHVVKEPNASTYIGKGFIQDILYNLLLIQQNPDILLENIAVAANFDLSGTQRANLKKIFNVEVIDRSFVILKIFENNAHTKEAKLQVEIASLTWQKNHLIDSEEGYSQVTSGGGMHNKGSGEKQLSLDRRHISILIKAKKRELESIKIARKNSRTKRNNSPTPKIAVVGYTNAGKSTLINSLIDFSKGDKKVLVKDQLFATLETSTREISKYGYLKFLLTDTVGFISDLPTTLINAFRSTLEEIKEADLLVHVVDISNPNHLEQIEVTNDVLKEIGVKDIPTIYLFNKYDLLTESPNKFPEANAMFCSLIDKNQTEDVYRFISSWISRDWPMVKIEFPYEGDYGKFSSHNYILSLIKNKNGYSLTAYINPKTRYLYSHLLDKKS